jgi:phosphatidylglycerol:prolipoprotein diacylglycerol transferase
VLPVLFRVGPFSLFGFELGPFALHTYGVFVALGFLAGIALLMRGAKRDGLPAEKMLDLAFATVLAAIVGSRLMYVLFNPGEYLAEPLRVFKLWEGGLVFHGGLLLAIPLLWFLIRRAGLPLWRTADVFAPAIAAGQAVGRLGCFFAGCCYGCPTESFWGVIYTHPEALAPLHVPLVPVQLLASFSGWVVFGALALFRRRRPAEGQVFWLYLVLASLARVVEDAYRGTAAKLELLPWLSATQLIALLLCAGGIVLFVRFRRRKL